MLAWHCIMLALMLLGDNQVLLTLELAWTRMELLLVVDDSIMMYNGLLPGLPLQLNLAWTRMSCSKRALYTHGSSATTSPVPYALTPDSPSRFHVDD